jgi:hypothetical protein
MDQVMSQIMGAPEVKRASMAQAVGGVGLSAEGQTGLDAVTLKFGSLNNDIRFIDLFNKGTANADWALTVPSYVIVTDAEGVYRNTGGEIYVFVARIVKNS